MPSPSTTRPASSSSTSARPTSAGPSFESRTSSSAPRGASPSTVTSRRAFSDTSAAIGSGARSLPSTSSTSSAPSSGAAPWRIRRVRPGRERRGDLAGNREHLAALLEREVGGDECAANAPAPRRPRWRAQAGDDPVPRREAPRRGLDSRRVLGDDQTVGRDPAGELRVRARIVAVDAAAENGDGRPAGVERAAVGLRVDPAGQAAHDDEAGRGQLAPEHARDAGAPYGAGAARADDPQPPAHRQEVQAAAPQVRGRLRRIVQLREQRPDSRARPPLARWARSRDRELRRRAVGERLRDVLAARPAALGERRDRQRDTTDARAAAARERRGESTARARSASPRRPSRPAAPRRAAPPPRRPARRTGADGSPAGRRARGARARGTVDDEIEAVEQRARELLPVASRAAAASTCTPRPDRRARRTGTGSSSRRAGTAPGRRPARRRARPRRSRPRAAGAGASSDGRGNSGSSSRSSTPRCARLASPGRGPGPAADDRRASTRCGAGPETAGARRAACRRRKQARDRVDPRHLERLVARRAAAGSRGAGARASSSRFRAGRRGAGCAVRRRRSRAPAGPVPGRARRARSGCGTADAVEPARPRARARARRGGSDAASARWRTGTGSMPASADLRRRLGGADEPRRARRAALPRPRRARPGTGRSRPSSASSPSAACSRERARPAAAATRRAPRARSAGRSPSPPCAARPARG